MNDFVEIPASKNSLSNRKLIYGVGINDANYLTQIKIDGKVSICPYYLRWKNLITRCYSSIALKKRPSYSDCFLCVEWLTFSNFKNWMKGCEWEGMHLDKDILKHDNKEYSPEFCIFVPMEVNVLFTDHGAARGDYCQGVTYDKTSSIYLSQCSVNGKNKTIGRFKTEKEAATYYNEFKAGVIRGVSEKYKRNTTLYNALIAKAEIRENDYANRLALVEDGRN